MPRFDPIAFLAEFCSIPTAPFHEHRVIDAVLSFAKRYRSLRVSRDAHGNTLLVRPGTAGRQKPRVIFVAHLDHPGFVVKGMLDARTADAEFRGGVAASFVDGSRVLIYDGDRVVKARAFDAKQNAMGRTESCKLKVASAVSPGAFGMFDVGIARVKGKRLHCRVCDDLAGAAATLAMLVPLAAKPATSDVGVLLTRAEEVGFIGAIAAAQERVLLRDSDRLISIETSAEQPVARQGEGVVLRIGDRTSVFHSAFSRFMFEQAEHLAKHDKTFRFQRALMPAGTCEATPFDAFGLIAGAICVPLGNYHNQDKARGKIAAEHVHLDDWRNMLKLFEAIGRSIHTFDGSHMALREQLNKRFEASRHLLGEAQL